MDSEHCANIVFNLNHEYTAREILKVKTLQKPLRALYKYKFYLSK